MQPCNVALIVVVVIEHVSHGHHDVGEKAVRDVSPPGLRHDPISVFWRPAWIADALHIIYIYIYTYIHIYIAHSHAHKRAYTHAQGL